MKEVYSPSSVGSSPLLRADRTKFVSEKIKIREKWTDHFEVVLNRPSSISDNAIEQLLQVAVDELLDITPTLEEVQIAIRQLSSGKAPGSDSIPAEMYKESGSALTGKLQTLIQLI